MFIVEGRVTRSGALTKKDGEVVTNKDGDTVHIVEVGGMNGITLWPARHLTADMLPPLGGRCRLQCQIEK